MHCVTNALQIHNRLLQIVRSRSRDGGKLNLVRRREYQNFSLSRHVPLQNIPDAIPDALAPMELATMDRQP